MLNTKNHIYFIGISNNTKPNSPRSAQSQTNSHIILSQALKSRINPQYRPSPPYNPLGLTIDDPTTGVAQSRNASPHNAIDIKKSSCPSSGATNISNKFSPKPVRSTTSRRTFQCSQMLTASAAAWLESHPTVEVISRDRGTTFADGATRGAKHPLQIANTSSEKKQDPGQHLDLALEQI